VQAPPESVEPTASRVHPRGRRFGGTPGADLLYIFWIDYDMTPGGRFSMRSKRQVPSMATLLREFAARHHLDFTELIRLEAVAIRSTSAANVLVNEAYSSLDESRLADPAVGLLLNMLHRNFELVEAAVVCFVSGCGAAAEVSARASVEASINISYMLSGSAPSRIYAYFEHYFENVDREIERWKVGIGHLPPTEQSFHQQAISKRSKVNGRRGTTSSDRKSVV
jgi:hypothetical protein